MASHRSSDLQAALLLQPGGGGNERVFVWEGESAEDLEFMDRLNYVGVLETYPAFDRTLGWQQAVAGDLDGFRERFAQTGKSDSEIEAAMDLRTRGHRAANPYAARREAREWIARQGKQ